MTLLATTMDSQQGVYIAPHLLWGNMLYAEDMETIKDHIMTPFNQWAAHVQSVLAVTKDRLQTLKWVRKVEKFRAGFANSRQAQRGYGVRLEPPSPEERELDLWTDYCDEPAKYGDAVWERWMELDAKLTASPKRWRLAAYWVKRQEESDKFEEEFRQRVAATRIQAAVRGHLVRNQFAWRNCCMCLAHRVCPLRTDKGYMCRDCGHDGPYINVPDNDEWIWYRASYVDETIPLKLNGR